MAIEIIMKNWGPFHIYLKQTWDEYNEKRKASFDPYEQFEINTAKELLVKAEREYVRYLGSIGEDHGREYLQWLSDTANEQRMKRKEATEPYMEQAYKKTEILMGQILNKFKSFRLAP